MLVLKGNIRAFNTIEESPILLAGVAQWIEHRPVNQRVTGSFPSQGTCLGCGPRKRQPHTDVSLPLFLSFFPSL